jgi:hypothetical protein
VDSLIITEEIPDVLDVYGKVDKERAEEWIWNDINKHPKGSKAYTFALYKMPLEERHALLSTATQTYFRKLEITERLREIRELPKADKPYITGRLEFIPNNNKGKVEFIPDEEGKWKIHALPYFSAERNVDTRNRFKQNRNGVYHPPINPEGCIGYDPFRYKKEDTSSSSLSKAAIVVYQKFDYFGSGNENKYVALYVDRPDDPETSHVEAVKACRFWGYPIMHERVIESVKRIFDSYNMIPFLLKSEKDGIHGMTVDSGGKMVQNALDAMVTKFSLPKNPDDIDQIAIHPFEETLMDMDGFDLKSTTKFDVFMAMVELEWGLKQITFTNYSDNSNLNFQRIISEIIPTRR